VDWAHHNVFLLLQPEINEDPHFLSLRHALFRSWQFWSLIHFSYFLWNELDLFFLRSLQIRPPF